MLASTKLEENEMEVQALGGVFLVSCTPVFDEKGNIKKIIHIATNITERKRAEEEIQRQLSIINTYSGMIALTDMEGMVIYMNAGGARMAGYEHPSKVIGIKRIPDFQFPKDLQHLMDVCIPTALEKGIWTGEGRLLKRDGSSIPVEQTIFVIRDENGQPHNLGAIVTDITDRKKAEEEIKNRVKELEDFYDMAVARELRMKELKEQMEDLKMELAKYKKMQYQ
jgi:PAS domain S-box-containing protein